VLDEWVHADRLARYADLVRACPHNLLSSRGLEELESRHIRESVALAADLPSEIDLVDVGPGGGLPGMVIALMRPDIAVTMVEATRKKADFLRQAATELEVEVDVRHGRIEELAAGEFAQRFDVATARAVASIEKLVGWVLPALRPGGELWAIKGKRWDQDLEDARPTLERVGAEVRRTPRFSTREPDPVSPTSPVVVIIGRARVRVDRGDT